MSSPTCSGSSSQRYVAARSDKTLRSTPRSPRTTSTNQQRTGYRSSQSGSKVRALDREEDRCLSHRPSRKCLKCQRDVHGSTAGLFPIQSGLNISSSRLEVRSKRRDSGSPCSSYNEAPQVDSDCSLRTARSQPHQRSVNRPFDPEHNTNRRLASENLVKAAALASPTSPVFPLPSSSSIPSTPPRHLRNRPHLTSRGSISSFASVSPSPLSRCNPPPASGYSTPSPSTRSRKSRSISSVSSSSLRPPTLSFLIRDGCPPRAPPTLAMSMQIHAPSPIMSTGPKFSPTNTRSHSQSISRPSSPSQLTSSLPASRPPMPRPPSRSEKLLRDTLRKAEEHERLMSLSSLPSPATFGATQPAHGFFAPPPSGGGRLRRNTASSTGTDASLDAFAYCDTGVCYSDEEEQDEVDNKRWLWRSPSSSSSSSAHGYNSPNRPPRHHGDDPEKRPTAWRSRAHSDVVHGEHADPSSSAYGSPASPSSARLQLQRSARSTSNAPRPPLPHTHSHASHGRSARNSIDGDRPCACTFTPHEAVLRSRLEGVLRGAQAHERRQSVELSGGSGSSNSLASSRNMSGEGESFFAAGERSMTFSPASNESELPTGSRVRTNTSSTAPANMYSHRRSLMTPQGMRSPKLSTKPSDAQDVEPLTPPPSPPFNAITAAEQCKAMNGYVSFANIAGLGMPDDEDEEEETETAPNSRWLKWLSLGSRRSESAVQSR